MTAQLGSVVARIRVDEAGEWRYHLAKRNGEPIDTSEGYTRRRDAVRAAITNTAASLIHVENRKGRRVRTIVVSARLRARTARRGQHRD